MISDEQIYTTASALFIARIASKMAINISEEVEDPLVVPYSVVQSCINESVVDARELAKKVEDTNNR